MSTKVGLVYDPIYLEHDTGGHVENSQRLTSIISYLGERGILNELSLVKPELCSEDDLLLCHCEDHIRRVKSTAAFGGWLDPDTITSPRSYEAATYAVGGVIGGMRSVMEEELASAFALVRPPGHHATRTRAMGFCLFNNVAIAARYALNNLAVSRILICDFDVHHGNSTAEAFYSDPRVLYFSTHQYPFYPGTGSMEDIGVGEGKGATVNVPLPSGCGDEEYIRVFEEILVPITRRFKPQLILVSAGFDPHFADPIGGMQVSVKGFSQMTSILKQLAGEFCEGRMVFSLEGGYDLGAISHSVKAIFDVLLNREFSEEEDFHPRASPGIGPQLERIKQIHHLGGSL